MQYTKKTLENGLKLITVDIKDSPSITVLVIVSAGSKYEKKEKNGLSHFLEHMSFKGTEKRPKALDISLELDSIGSQSNAFTSQEFTGYYAKAHPKHFSKILDVVSDIYLNPIFSAKEIEKEKGVIIEEINMYEDMPHRIVHEVFMEAMYGDAPAGWGIAGKKENILNMSREDFLEYRSKHYVASATTVIVSGSLQGLDVESEVKRVFEKISNSKKENKLPIVEDQKEPVIKIKQKETDQTHIVIGVRGFGADNSKNYTVEVLSIILGGGMSSRLFQKLREEMGVGYYVRSTMDEFTDHGFLAVSTGVDNTRVSEVVSVILNEMKRITTEKISDSELQKAKDFMIGNMYLSLESSDSIAEYYAMQDMLGEELLTPDELTKKIQAVTTNEILGVAKEIFTNSRLNMAIVGNIKNQEKIKNIFKFD